MNPPSAPTPPCPLDGHWQMKSGSFSGEPIPELVCQNSVLQVHGERYAFLLSEGVTDSGVIAWGTSAGSAELRSEGGPHHGRALSCEITTRGTLLRLVCSVPHPAGPNHAAQPYTALFSRMP